MSNTNIIAIIISSLIVIFSTSGYIWSKFVENELNKMDADIDELCKSTSKTCEALSNVGCTTEEATEAFKVFKEQLEYGIVTVDDEATIKPISRPRGYCQCDYCGTFYTEFISNCKNCGAQIKMPSEFYKRDYIIKMNYLKR